MDIVYRENTLTADEYIQFESEIGDALTSREQAARAFAHQLYSVAAYDGGRLVGIARLLGDAAIFYYINDVWVLPSHRGRGIGRHMVNRLVQYAAETSLPGTTISVCLQAAAGKEGFYEKLGFRRRPRCNEGAGMDREITIPEGCL